MSDYLVSALYGKKPEQLSADEKRLVSNLMSIVGGLTGYAVTGGDDVSKENMNRYRGGSGRSGG